MDTQFNEPTNQSSIKVPKVVEPTNKKAFLKTLETRVINSPMSHPGYNQQAKQIKRSFLMWPPKKSWVNKLFL